MIHNAATEMRRISDAVQLSSETVEDLGRQSDQIQFLQGELRAAKDTVNAKQQELIRGHEDIADPLCFTADCGLA